MKKKTLKKRIRQLERQIDEVRAEGFSNARSVARQVLSVAAKPLPEGCDRLCTPVPFPGREDGRCWVAEITPPDTLRWITPEGQTDYSTSSRGTS